MSSPSPLRAWFLSHVEPSRVDSVPPSIDLYIAYEGASHQEYTLMPSLNPDMSKINWDLI